MWVKQFVYISEEEYRANVLMETTGKLHSLRVLTWYKILGMVPELDGGSIGDVKMQGALMMAFFKLNAAIGKTSRAQIQFEDFKRKYLLEVARIWREHYWKMLAKTEINDGSYKKRVNAYFYTQDSYTSLVHFFLKNRGERARLLKGLNTSIRRALIKCDFEAFEKEANTNKHLIRKVFWIGFKKY